MKISIVVTDVVNVAYSCKSVNTCGHNTFYYMTLSTGKQRHHMINASISGYLSQLLLQCINSGNHLISVIQHTILFLRIFELLKIQEKILIFKRNFKID